MITLTDTAASAKSAHDAVTRAHVAVADLAAAAVGEQSDTDTRAILTAAYRAAADLTGAIRAIDHNITGK